MKSTMKPHGVVVPMISPFTADGAIDEPAVGRVVEHLLSARVAGIFALGTTGESASIHQDDKRKLVGAMARCVAGRAMTYAGISGNCLREAVEAAGACKQLGAQLAVAHPPFYYPLSDQDIEEYYQKLADACPLPLILYNIPKTTHQSIPVDAIERLSRHANVAGIKDSSGDGPRVAEIIKRCGGREDFSILAGSGPMFGPGLKMGADGIVPSTGNFAPELYQAMYEAAQRGQWDEVERLQEQSLALHARIQSGRLLGESLAALKSLMAAKGLCGPAVLPPLRPYQDGPL